MIQSGTFWLVLALAVPAYWLIPSKWRPAFLTAVSFGYLASLTIRSTLAAAGWSLLFYYSAGYLRSDSPRARKVLLVLILAALGFLGAFKYIPPIVAALGGESLVGRVLVPIGISYYVFKLIHYAVEVHRETLPEHSLMQFLAFMLWFPIFTAGPIERFDQFLQRQDATWKLDLLVEGGTRIVHGLIKKLVIAEVMLVAAYGDIAGGGALLAELPELSTARVWAYLAVTYLYIYMDFSAYTDIAVGCSRLFGLRIMENFRWPIVANSIGDFWRRWHISLSRWVQYYIYLPVMALTRKPYLSALASFTVIGLWHAGTLLRLSWGLYHFAGVAALMIWNTAKRKKKWNAFSRGPAWNALAIVVTQLFVTGSMAFLVVEESGGLKDGFRVLAKLVFVDLS